MKEAANSFFGAESVVNATQEAREKLHRALRILDDISVPSQYADAMKQTAPITEQEVRAILRRRRARDHFFDRDLFADPAWDILLELYAAELGQRRMSTTRLCAAAGVPTTTAMRWLGVLEKRGLLKRTADPFHGRRMFVSLTEKAIGSIAAYFAALSGD